MNLRAVDLALIRASRRARAGWHGLGPGLVTGVADDDPSGISTYTVTGATHGYGLLWTSIVTLPMNFAVQSICARIGIVTGQGLTATIARHYGRRWLRLVVLLLFIANVVNIAADIGAIAAAVALLTPLPAWALVAPIGVGIAVTEVVIPYPQFARYLKLLTLIVFAYILGAFAASPDWGAAAAGTFKPTLAFDRTTLAAVVALLGTTISPYLFFWQDLAGGGGGASARRAGRQAHPGRGAPDDPSIQRRRWDGNAAREYRVLLRGAHRRRGVVLQRPA